jgi:DNA-binding HxlR family transcriptional regulator
MTATKRSYGDSCGIARALDLVGERWALLVVRELVHGPKRFTDLRAGLPGVSADVLSQRLRDLERAGIVRRRTLPPPAPARVYELTAWGAELEPVLLALGRFGSRAPLAPEPPPLSVDATVMALQTTYRPAGGRRGESHYALSLGEDRFEIQAGDELIVRRGEARQPVAGIETDPGTLMAVLWHGQALEDAIADSSMRIAGDRAAIERLLGTFRTPVPARP